MNKREELEKQANRVFPLLMEQCMNVNKTADRLKAQRQADLKAISHHFAILVKDLEKVLK